MLYAEGPSSELTWDQLALNRRQFQLVTWLLADHYMLRQRLHVMDFTCDAGQKSTYHTLFQNPTLAGRRMNLFNCAWLEPIDTKEPQSKILALALSTWLHEGFQRDRGMHNLPSSVLSAWANWNFSPPPYQHSLLSKSVPVTGREGP
jgi:hypothetical protein